MTRVKTHPGQILRAELEARGMSANRLALAIRVPANRITAILRGRTGGHGRDGCTPRPLPGHRSGILDEPAKRIRHLGRGARQGARDRRRGAGRGFVTLGSGLSPDSQRFGERPLRAKDADSAVRAGRRLR